MRADTSAPLDAASLKRGAIRGASLAGAAQGAKTLIDAGAQLALLALIAPSHLGVFAFAQALTGFVSCFGDMAGQKFIIRSKGRLESHVVATVYWFELFLGAAVAATWALTAPAVMEWLGRGEQTPFAQALAAWIFLERFLAPKALLDRRMAFGRSNLMLLIAAAIGAGAMLTAAALGAGAWSLVIGLLSRTLCSGVLLTAAAAYRPLLRFDLETARELVRFGAPLMISTALAFAYTNVDYLIVGQELGFGLLGLYAAAYRYPHYLMQFSTILSSVILSSFAKTRDPEHLTRGLRLLTRYAAVVAFVFPCAVWTEGEWLVRSLLPEQWWGAVFPLQMFTTLAALRLTLVHWSQVFVAGNDTRPLAYVSVASLVAVSTGAWAGVRLAGLEGAAIGVSAAALTVLVTCCAGLLKRRLPTFSYGEALRPALTGALAFLLAALAVRFALREVAWQPVASILTGGLAYMLVVWIRCGDEMLRTFGGSTATRRR